MELNERIKFALREANFWWKDDAFEVKDYRNRKIFLDIEKYIPMRQIIALVGLRRTGKTTLMLKMIEKAAKASNRSNILYFSFDDFSSLDIEDILTAYKEIFADIDLRDGRFLFCFDEIQKLQNWQEKIKRLYDSHPNIKIIISGSESLFLRKKIKETLGGRIFEFSVTPLSFKEYLLFTDNEKLAKNTQLYKEDIVKLYTRFLKTNGFPEIALINDDMIIHKYLKESVIDKILFKDIPQLFNIKNPDIIAEMLDIIMFSPGQIIDTTKLSKELSLSRQVVSRYFDYLEKSFLIKKIYNFSKNMRKQKRSLKKYYPAVVFPSIVENNFPACFENSLIWQLGIQFFYRDAYKNEVDAVQIEKGKAILPIEIKTGKIDTHGVEYFMRKFKLKKGIVLTLSREEKGGAIEIIPFYKYL